MKFSTVVLSAVFGLSAMVAAIPQATTAASVAAPPASVATTPSQSTVDACLKACNPGDVYCQAGCEGIPTPDGSAVNATHNCIAACPKGSGSAADSAAFASCEANCVSSLYYTASSAWSTYTGPGLPAGITLSSSTVTTTGVATTTATGKSGSSPNGTTSQSGTAAPSPTGNAASTLGIRTPAFALLGFFLAALAL